MAATQLDKIGPRSRQVLALLAEGATNKDIACQLNMVERTVKAHLNRLFLRFGIEGGKKRVKLAVIAYRAQRAALRRKSGE